MSCYVFDDALRAFFNGLGRQIGKTPGYFIIVPLLLTALAATGMQRIVYESDPEYLFTPLNGRGKDDRSVQEKHFPQNFTDFDPSRISRGGKFARLIIQAADGGTILREREFNQILFVDELVRNLTFWSSVDERNYSYIDLCAQDGYGYCYDNKVLNLGRYGFMRDIESGAKQLSYPVHFDTDSYDVDGNFMTYTFPFTLGGVELSEDDSILKGAKAINLNYFLDSTTEEDLRRGLNWEVSFQQIVGGTVPSLADLKVAWISSLTLEVELEKNTNSAIPFFSFNVGVMIIFCVITCMMADWVKSKPLLGLVGVTSAVMGTVTAFGFCMYVGVPFIGINLAAPFLMLGIGIDDTFVTLAAWRRTSMHQSVPERLAQAYTDAAASITITSLTDMISFWVGIITPIPAVKIFCVYAGTCVTFTYLWHVTLFGGCMAIAGYAEKANRHAVTCLTVVPKSLSSGKGLWYNICCAGGINERDPLNEKDNAENFFMAWFRDTFAPFINKAPVKAMVLVFFSGYLALSGWAISHLEEGLERRHLARYDSYSIEFYDAEEQYFRDFSFRMSVIIDEPLDYSNRTVQEGIEAMLSDLEAHPHISSRDATESWLRQFLDYVRSVEGDPLYAIDISDEQKFVTALQSYLSSGYPIAKDVRIENGRIVGARFMLQAMDIVTTAQEKDFVVDIREIVDKYPFKVAVFNPIFVFVDQFISVFPTTVQCVTVAAGVMMVISLIFIPNPLCSLWVAFSIISIEAGVIGLMTLWGVRLDSISMINLIMCIGFSVDFSAHISYHFMQHRNMGPDDRVRESLYGLGLPIIQGAISTCLGVLGLALAPSYVFRTFFKMVSLVVVLGAVHGIVLLPVLLSIMGPGACGAGKEKSPEDSTSGKNRGEGGGVLSEKPEKCEKRWAFQTDGERKDEESNHKYYSHTINGGLAGHDPLSIPGLKIPRPKSSVSCPPGHNGGSVSDNSLSGGVGGNVSASTSLTEAATFNNTSLTVSINANTSPSNSQGSKDENRNHKRSKSRSTRPSVQEEVDLKERRKKSSSRSREGASNGVVGGGAGFKLHEMYTNRAYESSENTPGGSGEASPKNTPEAPSSSSSAHRTKRHSKTSNRQI